MPKVSVGLLMYRRRSGRLEVLLAHPGGPLFAGKDAGFWTIPKGEIEEVEGELEAARREFEEEAGVRPEGAFIPLGSITQRGGKIVRAWGFEGDRDPGTVRSNTFRMEWPPRSGKLQEFAEIDRVEFFSIEEAKRKINPAQVPLVEALERLVPGGDLV